MYVENLLFFQFWQKMDNVGNNIHNELADIWNTGVLSMQPLFDLTFDSDDIIRREPKKQLIK